MTTNRAPSYLNHVPDACLFAGGVGAFLIAKVLPGTVVMPAFVQYAGWSMVAVAILLILHVLARLRKHSSTNPLGTPRTLLTTGVFAYSRNPLYAADILAVTGCALASGSYMSLVFPALCFIIIDRLVIPVEESFLALAHSSAYAAYRSSVRRWLRMG